MKRNRSVNPLPAHPVASEMPCQGTASPQPQGADAAADSTAAASTSFCEQQKQALETVYMVPPGGAQAAGESAAAAAPNWVVTGIIDRGVPASAAEVHTQEGAAPAAAPPLPPDSPEPAAAESPLPPLPPDSPDVGAAVPLPPPPLSSPPPLPPIATAPAHPAALEAKLEAAVVKTETTESPITPLHGMEEPVAAEPAAAPQVAAPAAVAAAPAGVAAPQAAAPAAVPMPQAAALELSRHPGTGDILLHVPACVIKMPEAVRQACATAVPAMDAMLQAAPGPIALPFSNAAMARWLATRAGDLFALPQVAADGAVLPGGAQSDGNPAKALLDSLHVRFSTVQFSCQQVLRTTTICLSLLFDQPVHPCTTPRQDAVFAQEEISLSLSVHRLGERDLPS